jgi:FkbM family methyltransferase
MFKGLSRMAKLFATHPLTKAAPLRAWARFLVWQIKSRMSRDVVFPWIEGQKLLVKRGMTGATGNIYLGLHEFEDMMFPLHFLREGDLFLDIGANVGSYTVLASGVARATTWSFEPDPVTAQHLRNNIAINHLDASVTVHEYALGESQGTVSFTVGKDTMNKISNSDGANLRIVRQEKLDAITRDVAPLMIKMDVEGYEEQVLTGATQLLMSPGLKVIELETVSEKSRLMLIKSGFEQVYYDPFTRQLSPTAFASNGSNALYIKDFKFVQARLKQARNITIQNRKI